MTYFQCAIFPCRFWSAIVPESTNRGRGRGRGRADSSCCCFFLRKLRCFGVRVRWFWPFLRSIVRIVTDVCAIQCIMWTWNLLPNEEIRENDYCEMEGRGRGFRGCVRASRRTPAFGRSARSQLTNQSASHLHKVKLCSTPSNGCFASCIENEWFPAALLSLDAVGEWVQGYGVNLSNKTLQKHTQ